MSNCLPRLPKFIAFQVPILAAEPAEGHGWVHEIKQDGFRTLLRMDRGDGGAREDLQERIARLPFVKAPANVPKGPAA